MFYLPVVCSSIWSDFVPCILLTEVNWHSKLPFIIATPLIIFHCREDYIAAWLLEILNLTWFLWFPACSAGHKWWCNSSRAPSGNSSWQCHWIDICSLWIFDHEMFIWCSFEAAFGYSSVSIGRTMWKFDRFSTRSNLSIQWILHCS